jgi:UDP-glucose 4-epimerase
MKNILVVGGAGYIGSHMCKYLHKEGYNPIVFDNLIHGHKEAVKWGAFIKGDIADKKLLRHVFSQYEIAVVMHYAAYCYVGESVLSPDIYYRNNVADTLNLLDLMVENKVLKFIFSSSCAIFGEPHESPITESHSKTPINPYGKTKLIVEQILADYDHAYGLKSTCLRYFNAAGADPDGEIGEDHKPETHLIPLIIQVALSQRDSIDVFGNNYLTHDGTCIRDYIHVVDLAQAHYLAMEQLFDGENGQYNLGNGKGFSILEVIKIIQQVTGKTIPFRYAQKRIGDPATLIGSNHKAAKTLNYTPNYPDLQNIINTAWKWHKNNPHGFQK